MAFIATRNGSRFMSQPHKSPARTALGNVTDETPGEVPYASGAQERVP